MQTTLSSTFLAMALLAPAGLSQNLLTNGNFDSGGLAGWGVFGNAFSQAANAPQFVPLSNPNLVSMFGNFTGSFNVSGIFQTFPASPGQAFTIDCWSRHYSGDPMVGVGAPNDNWVVMKIAFFDAAGTEISGVEGTILDGNSPMDVWIDNPAVTGTAPLGTASVQSLILYLQPGTAGGAGQVDDVEFTRAAQPPTYPGSGEDLQLATGLAGATPSTGGGNDVKTAAGGLLLEVNVTSPQTTYDLMPYWLLGQAFTTGSAPAPTMPGVYFDFSQPIALLIGPSLPPFVGPVIRPGAGSSAFFVTPAGMAGFSLMVQGVVATPTAANGMFAITDGHEIQLQ